MNLGLLVSFKIIVRPCARQGPEAGEKNNKSGLLDSNILLFLSGETEWGLLWILGAIQLEGEVAMGARTTECIKSIFGRKLEFSKSGGE